MKGMKKKKKICLTINFVLVLSISYSLHGIYLNQYEKIIYF